MIGTTTVRIFRLPSAGMVSGATPPFHQDGKGFHAWRSAVEGDKGAFAAAPQAHLCGVEGDRDRANASDAGR
jgi:hypothetical protein